MKIFNTAGPVNQKEHYTLDPLSRLNLEEIELLIEQKKYFIRHAPRQTGKTSCLLALTKHMQLKSIQPYKRWLLNSKFCTNLLKPQYQMV